MGAHHRIQVCCCCRSQEQLLLLLLLLLMMIVVRLGARQSDVLEVAEMLALLSIRDQLVGADMQGAQLDGKCLRRADLDLCDMQVGTPTGSIYPTYFK